MGGFPIGAIVQAGGSIISSLLQKKPKTITPRQQILSTVKGAREAGIHPLAAFGSGAGYTQVGGGSSVGSAIGGGLERLGAQLANQKTEEEINATKADTQARLAQADLFRAQSRSILANAASGVRGGAVRSSPVKDITGFGATIRRDPSLFSSAQDVSDEFGDVAENLIGIPSMIQAAGRKALDWYGDTQVGKLDKAFEQYWKKRATQYQFNRGKWKG